MGWFFFSRPKPPPPPTKPPRRKKIDDGLWVRRNGPQSLTVEVSQKWYETQDDSLPVSDHFLKEFRAWRLVAPGCFNDADAAAISDAMSNMEHPCPRCGDETVADDVKCVHCGARLWQQTLNVDLVHVAK